MPMSDRARSRPLRLRTAVIGLLIIACVDRTHAGDTDEFPYPDSRAGEIARYPQLRGRLGTLSPHTVLDQTPSGLKLLARSETRK